MKTLSGRDAIKAILRGDKFLDGMVVKGSFCIYDCPWLISLPKGMTVTGYLEIRNCPALTSLPKGLRIGAYLSIHSCPALTSLPKGLRVGGYLSIRSCPALTSLPKELGVGGNLYIQAKKVIIDGGRVSIECATHTLAEWEAMSDAELLKLHPDALDIKAQYGNIIRQFVQMKQGTEGRQ